ncbi:hypothetical protein RZS08_42860, partial [Arthrospira platensis SPKY1]|nr:hypothetical protein [Arthrospira platensis SPKY1]
MKKRTDEADLLVDSLVLNRANTFTLQLFKCSSFDEFKTEYKSFLRRPLRELVAEAVKSLSEGRNYTELNGLKVRTAKGKVIHVNVSIAWPDKPEAFRAVNITLNDITN